MASKKKDTPKASEKGYQPKATARHAKITKTKQDEIDSFKKKIDTDKYLAKKYESNRKTEIKALPKEERAAAKEELKESIRKRKEGEERDREKLRELIYEEKAEKRIGKGSFDDEAWVKEGKKKKKGAEEPLAEDVPAIEPEEEAADDDAAAETEAPEETAEVPEPETVKDPEKKD
ncbi:MAG: hypothetical protein FWG96_05680 [Methanomassiliicoccaceae archaeon]|nr:hypothetical protein [Methanomassiliicoccaceae archaeon]